MEPPSRVWSALESCRRPIRRADRAPGRCRAGEGLAWREGPHRPPCCVSLSLLWTHPFSQDEVEVLRQWPGDRRLEEAAGLRVDDHGSVRGEEGRDLLLVAEGDRAHRRR